MLMQNRLIPLTLEQHQQILYEILYMVDDFCKAHDIPYFLVGGSLLGAVRHQGIIPWDDDVDIAMTRDNYERFIKEFHAESVEGYELYDFEHKEDYLFPFAKLVKNNTWTPIEYHKIHIDIFVYDGCGDSVEQAQSHFSQVRENITRIIRVFLLKPSRSSYGSGRLFLRRFPIDFTRYYYLKLFPKRKNEFIRQTYAQCQKYKLDESKYSACIVWGVYGKGEIQPSESFIKLTAMTFGERNLPVPSGWHKYLTGIYGDYMTPPPLENRRRRHTDASYLIN